MRVGRVFICICMILTSIAFAQDKWFSKHIASVVTQQQLKAVVPITGTERVLFAGNGGSAVIYDPNSANGAWQEIRRIGNSLLTLHDGHFFDAENGVLLGESRYLFITADGGRHWNSYDIGSTGNLSVFSAASAQLSFIGTAAGDIYKSTNAGQSWQSTNFQSASRITGLAFSDASTGYMTTAAGQIFRTSNGGDTWSLIYESSNDPISFNDIDVNGPDSAYAVGVSGRIWYTYDGGVNWATTRGSVNDGTTYYQIECLPGGVFVLAGGQIDQNGLKGFLRQTFDFGITLAYRVVHYDGVEFFGLGFQDDSTGYAVGKQGTIYRTENQGLRWELLHQDKHQDFYDIDFATNKIGYITGSRGALYKTEDGGNSWSEKRLNLVVETDFKAVDFLTADVGIIVGGTILRTGNGFDTWFDASPGRIDDYRDIRIVTAGAAYTVGEFSSIYKSADQGFSWKEQTRDDGGLLRSVFFHDEMNGFAIAENRFIYTTANGGEEWKKSASSVYPGLEDIAFASRMKGFIVGGDQRSGGWMLETVDGGFNWQLSANIPATTAFRQIEFYDEMSGALLDQKGNLWLTRDGGNSWHAEQILKLPTALGLSFRPDGKLILIGEEKSIQGDFDNRTQLQNAIGHSESKIGSTFKLRQNYPNPFNPSTRISYELVATADIDLAIYNLLGQKIRQLVEIRQEAGTYEVLWDGKDSHGVIAQSGVYFYRLTDGKRQLTAKMILLK